MDNSPETAAPQAAEHEDGQDSPFPIRRVDTASLKALAHPLRVQILEMLSRYGAQTACSLGELLNESSGSTSYHLRQLAKHDFVREVEGKGTARERWWERPRGAIQITSPELATSPATEEASRLVTREFEHSRQSVLAEFMSHGSDSLDAEWLHAAAISTSNARLNASQLSRYAHAMEAYGHRLLEEIRSEGEQEGARPVQIHFNAFPILGVPASAGSRSPRKAGSAGKAVNTNQASPERKVP
jgi:DNA-binding transcriptional ArsR family regulator